MRRWVRDDHVFLSPGYDPEAVYGRRIVLSVLFGDAEAGKTTRCHRARGSVPFSGRVRDLLASIAMKSTITDRFSAYHGDTIEVARAIPTDSCDYSIFSPPFCSLYTFSNSDRDMSNVKNPAEFFGHFRYLIREQFRVMKPGRLVSVHCMMLTTSLAHDGHIGMYDFRGDIIREYRKCQLEIPCGLADEFNGCCPHGFGFHSEVVIWKDPVVAMQRTKSLGLLHKTIRTDSSRSRQGCADYVVTFRKPGTNPDPISHWSTSRQTKKPQGDQAKDEQMEIETWQQYASPVWMDINPGDTLQHKSAREHEDERHISPLQLEVIRRCVKLWSRKDDVVWSPFMGIGSEGYVALQSGRRFIGAELKASYYEQAVRNLTEAQTVKQETLFALDAG